MRSSERNMGFCEENNVNAYIALQRQPGDENFPPKTPAQRARFVMRVKLLGDKGKAVEAKAKGGKPEAKAGTKGAAAKDDRKPAKKK